MAFDNVRCKPNIEADFVIAAEGGAPSVEAWYFGLRKDDVRDARRVGHAVKSCSVVGLVGKEGLAKGSKSSSSRICSDPSIIISWQRRPPSLFFTANGAISARWPLIEEETSSPWSVVPGLSEVSEEQYIDADNVGVVGDARRESVTIGRRYRGEGFADESCACPGKSGNSEDSSTDGDCEPDSVRSLEGSRYSRGEPSGCKSREDDAERCDRKMGADASGFSTTWEPGECNVLEGAGEEGADWAKCVFTSSDIDLAGVLDGKSSRLDEDMDRPSGLVGLSEGARCDRESS